MICFRPEPDPAADPGPLVVALDATAIAPLAGRGLHVSINKQSYDHLLTPGATHVFRYPEHANSNNRLICMKFDLPLTIKDLWDFRGLGLLFKGLRYSYEAPRQERAQ